MAVEIPQTETFIPYSAALDAGDPALSYPTLLAGPYRDEALGATVIGDAHNVMRVLENRNGEFTNQPSVTPWWLKSPLSVSPRALPALRRTLGYPDAMQTVEGPVHAAVSTVVTAGMARIAQSPEYRAESAEIINREASRLGGLAVSGASFDLAKSLGQVRTKLLGHELGMSTEMQQELDATMASQLEFLWGWPAPERSRHRQLAKQVGSMFAASYDLFAGYHKAISNGRETPPNLTADLAQAVLDGKVPEKVAISTLFGLVNAGKGTAADTGANLASGWLNSGEWAKLAADPSVINRTIRQDLPTASAVIAWQKGVAKPVTLHGHEGSIDLERRERLIVVLGAVASDPLRNGETVPFSAGQHKCPGDTLTYRYLKEYFRTVTPVLPGLELAGEPTRSLHITFNSITELPVRSGSAA